MKWLGILSLIFVSAMSALSQSPCSTVQMPAGTICISQQAANKAAENARELEATKGKVTVLEDAIKVKDQQITDLRSTSGKNEADLKEALHKTEVELAKVTGQVIQLEADRVRWTAVIDLALKNTRKSCKPFSVCF